MSWLVTGLILTLIHIILLKYIIKIRIYSTKNKDTYTWTEDQDIPITFKIVIYLFLISIIPFFNIIISILWLMSILYMSIVGTKKTILHDKYTLFVISNKFLGKWK